MIFHNPKRERGTGFITRSVSEGPVRGTGALLQKTSLANAF